MKGLSLITRISLFLLPVGSMSFIPTGNSTPSNIPNSSTIIKNNSGDGYEPGDLCFTYPLYDKEGKPDPDYLNRFNDPAACKVIYKITAGSDGSKLTEIKYEIKPVRKDRVKTPSKRKEIKKQREAENAKNQAALSSNVNNDQLESDTLTSLSDQVNQAVEKNKKLERVKYLAPLFNTKTKKELADILMKEPNLLDNVDDNDHKTFFSKLEEKGLKLDAYKMFLESNDPSQWGKMDYFGGTATLVNGKIYLPPPSERVQYYQAFSDILSINPENYNQTQKTIYTSTSVISFGLFASMIYGLTKVSALNPMNWGRKKQYFLGLLALGLMLSSGMGVYMLYNLIMLA